MHQGKMDSRFRGNDGHEAVDMLHSNLRI